MIIETDAELAIKHVGVLRKSGRYPWGSGESAYQRHKEFIQYVMDAKKQGMTDADIAKFYGIYGSHGEPSAKFPEGKPSSNAVRALLSYAKDEVKAQDIATVTQMRFDREMSTPAISAKTGIPESQVRALLDPATKEKAAIARNVADEIKKRADKGDYVDVGAGVEHGLRVSNDKLKIAVAILEEQGYVKHWVQQPQAGTGKNTNVMVITKPGTTWKEVVNNKANIKTPYDSYTEDGGRTFKNIRPPVAVDPKRVAVKYGPDGGALKDGVIELRRGTPDLSLGEARYAQVRIQVGEGHYLKGMAMYSDKLPDGVDIQFNTNKKTTGNKLDAMKELKEDKDLPFGSITRQRDYPGPDGKLTQSPLNIVGTYKKNDKGQDISVSGEEGGWSQWSRNLSSQALSKQSPQLAKEQLGLTFKSKQSELDDIMALTNPAVKKKLLDEFADSADSSAKHLKAAGLPGTKNHVILPILSLKENEVYAPGYNNGDKVALIRHPHGGKFEIPELTVNNRNREANSVIKGALDAVGINPKVASRLSGADFDGDTVLVIPNNRGQIKSRPALASLKDFDPQRDYKGFDGMKTIDGGRRNAATGKTEFAPGVRPNKGATQLKMGDISNLITDMTIKGANEAEIARAVKHSMVVIDAEKHGLNFRQSYKDQGIAALKTDYQGGPTKGASTVISKAKSEARVPEQKLRKAKAGGPIDPATGKLIYEPTGASYVDKKTGKTVVKTTKTTKMDNTDDAHTLSSGTRMESVYADHANRLKALANQARKESLATPPVKVNDSAKATYSKEISSLNAKLKLAQENAPRERQAQLLQDQIVRAKKESNPHLEKDELKKLKTLALNDARLRTGAKKPNIDITPREWEAIQSGGVANARLVEILRHAKPEVVKEYATPRDRKVMSDSKVRQAQSLLARGYTQAEIASQLGVPASTLSESLK